MRCGVGGLLLAVLPLAGCQSTGRPQSVASAERPSRHRLKSIEVADVQIAMARTLEEGGKPNEAAVVYAQALKKDPRRADACLHLAILCDRQGKVEEAASWYKQAHNLAPGDPDVHASQGYGLYLRREWQAAEKHLRQALALCPDHQRAHNNLGLVLARCGRKEEALAEFRLAGCSEAEARSNLAHALSLQGRWDAALVQYRAALRVDPGCALARRGVAQVQRLQARLEKGPLPGGQPGQGNIVLTGATVPAAQAEDEVVPPQPLPPGLSQAPALSGTPQPAPK